MPTLSGRQVVTSYGMSDLGITTWAPPGRKVGFMQRNFEVHVDNIDADLFGNSIPGGMFQSSNSALYKVRRRARVRGLERLRRASAPAGALRHTSMPSGATRAACALAPAGLSRQHCPLAQWDQLWVTG